MAKNNIQFFHALAVMIGYIVGVGIFGLPYLLIKAGIVPFLIMFAVLIGVQYAVHLIYGSIILMTGEKHRMPGHVEIFMGKKWKTLVFIGKFTGGIGAILAYIIVTGIFLNELLAPFFGGVDNTVLFATIFFAIEALIVYLGLGVIAKTELVMTGLLLAVVGLIAVKGVPYMDMDNVSMINWEYILLPYGALLFSFDGNGSLPVVASLVNRDRKAMKKVIRLGTFISAAVTLLFALTISFVSGESTSSDALSGLRSIMNGSIFLALIFGVLTMATSFFGVAQALRESLHWDYKMNDKFSWAIAVLLPFILYMAGIENLTVVISFVGALGGGICALTLVLIYIKLKKQGKVLPLLNSKGLLFMPRLFMILILLGMAYTLWEYLIK